MMTIAMTALKKNTAGAQAPATPQKKWCQLLLGILLLLFFMFVLGPWLRHTIPSIDQLATYIDESGIDSTAIYYTEVEEVGEADISMRDTLRFYTPYKK